jgi:hypothetical protein
MNPGPIEEGEKVASGLVDALKAQPVILALVVFQVLFLGLSYIGIEHARKQNLELVTRMIDSQARYADMLYNCTPFDKEKRQP